MPLPHSLTIIHANHDLLVLNKPAGLLCVPGRGADKQDCLSARAQAQFADALIVHRLDMATSGLLLMARGSAMQRALSQAFERREVDKRYVAVVDGHLPAPAQEWGEINLPIAADWPRRPLRVINPEIGQASLTRWRVLAHECDAQGAASTRLELAPVTGRTHQLRVHLQAIGHAILGDALYASAASQARAPRLLLHASSLTLRHPHSGAALRFDSAPPF